MDRPILSIKNINKKFGNIIALEDFSLDVFKGEFITVLGPSGCGKTTLLRIISGLEVPDSGNVLLEDVNVDNLPPEKRDINTVFQNFALFPHMNVYQNISYGLKLRKMKKSDIKESVTKALQLVQLSGYEKRKVDELSGGQKQRVAIARAIVLKPRVLLLDEPLGALDYKLRLSMQSELKKMQKALGTTFIYITHDQDEALNLSDRIVLMNKAKIEQIGTPDEIYKHPKSLFAAKFIGEPNVIKCKNVHEKIGDFGVVKKQIPADSYGEVYAIIRPESISIDPSGVKAVVNNHSVKGGVVVTELSLDDKTILKMHSFDTHIKHGEEVRISCNAENVHLIHDFDGEYIDEK